MSIPPSNDLLLQSNDLSDECTMSGSPPNFLAEPPALDSGGEMGLPLWTAVARSPASQKQVTGESGQAGVVLDPKKEGRCSKCGIGDEVSLEVAQQKMDPDGLYKWNEDEFSMYCHP
jgi:hypothetical protein